MLDPSTRRLLVRATIDNSAGALKPEMFASVRIMVGDVATTLAVPRCAVMYEGNGARVRVVHDDKTIELRPIKTGLADGDMVQVLDGLAPGEKVITKGSLFIDRAAGG
jgi:cobalt-zinc-cadmium efflux system membrane fusion protein